MKSIIKCVVTKKNWGCIKCLKWPRQVWDEGRSVSAALGPGTFRTSPRSFSSAHQRLLYHADTIFIRYKPRLLLTLGWLTRSGPFILPWAAIVLCITRSLTWSRRIRLVLVMRILFLCFCECVRVTVSMFSLSDCHPRFFVTYQYMSHV